MSNATTLDLTWTDHVIPGGVAEKVVTIPVDQAGVRIGPPHIEDEQSSEVSVDEQSGVLAVFFAPMDCAMIDVLVSADYPPEMSYRLDPC